MTWNVTMLLVHLAAFFALRALFPNSPDRIQKGVVFVLGACFLTVAFAYSLLAVAPLVPDWLGEAAEVLKGLARSVEHVAILLLVFRLFIVDQERRCLPNSSARFHSSPR